MPHAPGARFGPYEVIAVVGAGGMGEVYKARDTRLDRIVALKVSKEAFGERFRNEALAVAALNHPHISTLHDVGPDYLVMEFVDGRPVRGPLPVAEAVRLAGEIADALEHAHKHGIVHRDLKPSNILVTKAGVKVLDFGLAKRRGGPPPGESQTTLTEEGAVVGTPRYMAPEQIEGKPADARSDIFAFGLVLYEMLTGRHAFEGKSAAAVMAAILEYEPPPIESVRRGAPQPLQQVVMTCLAKDPEERWQSVRELKHALAWSARPEQPGRRGRSAGWIAVAVASTAVAAALAVALARRSPGSSPGIVSFDLTAPPGTTFRYGQIPAVSPDGERIAFVAHDPGGRPHLFLRSLRAASATRVPGTEGASHPFWSADGGEVAFAAEQRIKRVKPSGGPPQVLCALTTGDGDYTMYGLRGATWSAQGTILFADWDGQLWRTSTNAEEPTPAGKRSEGERGRYWPQFLPDGRRYLYWSHAAGAGSHGVYVASLDSDERTLVLTSDLPAAYSSGHLLFQRGNTLIAQAFDVSRLRLSGDTLLVAENVALVPVPSLGGPSYAAGYSASADGVVAWQTAALTEGQVLTWFDRSGRKLGTVGEPAEYTNPALSPDGTTLAVGRRDSRTGTRDVWVFDAARGAGRRLTFDRADDFGPVWSPDGKWIAFASDRSGMREIYRKLADGSGGDERLLASRTGPLSVMDWSADGRFLIYNHWPGGKPIDLHLLPLGRSGPGTPFPLLATPSVVEDRGQFDPSGRFIAYNSDESGRTEAYVVSVSREGAVAPGKWQVSTGGGHEPRWRRDGRELYYVAPGVPDRLMAVDVRIEAASFAAGTPRALFEVRLPGDVRRNRFVVSPDGQRFLVIARADQEIDLPIRTLVNWPSLPR